MDFSDDDKDEICYYSPKYGFNSIDSIHFDDHSILGSNYLQYKPEKIVFWTSELGIITGLQTWFRNIIDNNYVNSGENKGLNSKYRHIFSIKPKEYLTECKIRLADLATPYINSIYLKTNTGRNFEIGINEGIEISIDYLKYGNKIIISFLGSYNRVLESFGFHAIDKKDYMKVIFSGFFELKKILKNEKRKEELFERLKGKEFSYEDEAVLRTCLLPTLPLNEILKYLIF